VYRSPPCRPETAPSRCQIGAKSDAEMTPFTHVAESCSVTSHDAETPWGRGVSCGSVVLSNAHAKAGQSFSHVGNAGSTPARITKGGFCDYGPFDQHT
jgi:hypothetical protein